MSTYTHEEGKIDHNPLHSGSHIDDSYGSHVLCSATVSKDPSRQSSVVSESTWIRDKASEYDFCIVFPAQDGEFTDRGRGYLESLRDLGYDLFIYKNIYADREIFVLLKTPMEKIRAFADLSDFPLLLDSQEIDRLLWEGDAERGIAGEIRIADRRDIVKYHPYEKIYGKYSRNEFVPDSLYYRPPNEDSPFTEGIRLKLTALILESRKVGGSQNLKIRRYLRSKWMLGCFPMHNRVTTELLEKKWYLYPFQKLPLEDMKNYFGEKIGLYFAFLEHYTWCLIFPAMIGIPLQLAVFALNNYNAIFLPFYSFFIALWAVCMLEFWKRKEKTNALDWGMIDFERNEHDRPDFQGPVITSFIDGSQIRYIDSKQRFRLIFQSALAISALVLLVIGVVVGIYLMRFYLSVDEGGPLAVSTAQTLASVMNAVQIQVMNYIYSFLANALSERENHRTETQFEDSMISKIFMFQFVNSYASFFYIAFIASFVHDCSAAGCMETLAINLAIIYGTRLASSQVTGLLIPYLTYQYKYRKETEHHASRMTRPEKEFLLQPYDLLSSSLDDYADIAIQFGYTSMFVTALPMAAFFALVTNFINVRFKGFKLFNLHQRPFPKGAEDIGTWQAIFLTLSVIAVVTNAGLTVFTMDCLDKFNEVTRYWIFILFQWVCFTLQVIIMEAIPDVPEDIEIQLQRTEFIVDKLIDKVADDDDNDATSKVDPTAPIVYDIYPVDVGGRYSEAHGHNFLTDNMH